MNDDRCIERPSAELLREVLSCSGTACQGEVVFRHETDDTGQRWVAICDDYGVAAYLEEEKFLRIKAMVAKKGNTQAK